jgi:hypothetical protein
MADDLFYSQKSRNHEYTVKYRYIGILHPEEYEIYIDGEYAETVNSERELHERIEEMIENEEL